jgi:translation initiation factor 1
MADDSKLVYSTDPNLNKKCTKCKELVSECTCQKSQNLSSSDFTAVLRIETAGRNGKTVTVIDKLPRIHPFLEKLCKLLKNKCGSGGTYRVNGPIGRIEIQGDKRELIRKILTQEGISYKG